MLHAAPPPDEHLRGMEPLRSALERRRARRYRRRWFSRWRRRRLLLRLVAIEFELADPRDDALQDIHKREAQRLEDRLSRNARRLFR